MKVPFLPLKIINDKNNLVAAAVRVIKSGWFILGEEVSAFEKEFARYCGAAHCVGAGNGLDALTLMLRAGIANQKTGDEIIVPANTYIATLLAIEFAGFVPVLAEPDAQTFNINEKNLTAALSEKTRAVMAVHLYGRAAKMSSLLVFCEQNNLSLFADAAQAHGAMSDNQPLGAQGLASAFSFYPGKNLGAVGDGGAVVTNDGDLAKTVRALRNYGSLQKNETVLRGVNSRLDELQAAVLREKLLTLDDDNKRRKQIAARYLNEINHPQIILPQPPKNVAEHVWHLFVVRCDVRDELQKHLLGCGVQTLVHYPIPPHRQPVYKESPLAKLSLPVTEKLSRETLSLPLNIAMDDSQVAAVIRAVNAFS